MSGTSEQLSIILSGYYKSRVWKNLWNLFLSSNALGNVNMLVYDIGTGVKDFFYKPIDGFIIGPLEGGKGLYKGTSSLIFNISKGTFGSVSKIMNAISKGLLIFTDDKEYMILREQNQIQKPENVIHGFR